MKCGVAWRRQGRRYRAQRCTDRREQRDEEFVRVLLLVARDRLGAAPHPMEKRVWAQRFRPAGEELTEQQVHLTRHADAARRGDLGILCRRRLARPAPAAPETVVPAAQEVPGKKRAMRENLEDAIHEARVAEVDQPPHTRARGRMVAHPPTKKAPSHK